MRVAKLELTGVGPFEGAVFEIPEPSAGTGELVFFEGPNGSGKTTLLQTIAIAASGYWGSIGSNQQWTEAPREAHQRRCQPTLDLKVHIAPGQGLATSAVFPSAERLEGPVADVVARYLSAVAMGRSPVDWIALTYAHNHPTALLKTHGPKDIGEPPLRGALSFGGSPVGSRDLGQLLTNLESERVRAAHYAQERTINEDERQRLLQTAAARRESLARFERVLSRMLDRAVAITFPFDQHSPKVTLDGDEIAIDLLGEGLRTTFSWLADLLVRLERVVWVDATRSPLDQELWLILDEVELSLHPTMQANVYPALRELLPNAHIYASTHSPFVIASAGEGVVFPIQPDRDHKVRGLVKARPLRPGESLELVTEDVFGAPSGFVDRQTRDDIRAHDKDTQALRRKEEVDWTVFMARRDRLMTLNDEVRTIVAMQEAPVKHEVLRRLRERIAESERGAST